MARKPKNSSSGFTLIELLIAVAIVAILAAIAYPSYMNSVLKSGRADAKVELNDVAQRLQRCFTAYNAYNSSSCAVTTALNNGGILSREGLYNITVSLTATTYTLTAAPVSTKRQSKDVTCGSFTLTHTGVRGSTGDPAICW